MSIKKTNVHSSGQFVYDATTGKWVSVAGTSSGAASVSTVSPSGLGSGQKNVTTAGTAVALAATTTIVSVTITALRTNTGFIYVGGSGVDSTNGLKLVRGASVSMDITDIATVFIDSDTNGEGVSFLYLTA